MLEQGLPANGRDGSERPAASERGALDEALLERIRDGDQRAFAELSARINLLLALPIDKLDRLVLKKKLDEIGRA